MAIFASTTTSGYSDPLKAYSIKALEQRQRDMLQQQTQQPQAFTPENTQTPLQGLAQVANVGVDAFRQRRNDDAVAAQKAELSQLIAGTPPGQDLSPQAQARMAVIAPDMYKDVQAAMSARRAQEAGFTHADKAAAEAARVAREAKIDEEQRLANRPASEGGKIMQDVQSGKITPEEGKAQIDKLSAPSASEMKAGNELQNTHLDTQSALSDMREARGLMGPEGTGIRAGSGAGLAQAGAKWGGDKLGLTDPSLTQPTERFNQLMNAEAITAMAAKLKGASTDYEMKAFVALMNDPNAEPKTKMQALDKMIAKAEAHLSLQQEQLKRAKVSAPAGAGGSAPAAAANPVAEAQAAIDRGAPFDAVAARFKQNGGDPSALKPKGP